MEAEPGRGEGEKMKGERAHPIVACRIHLGVDLKARPGTDVQIGGRLLPITYPSVPYA